MTTMMRFPAGQPALLQAPMVFQPQPVPVIATKAPVQDPHPRDGSFVCTIAEPTIVPVDQQKLRVIFDRLDINRDGVLEWNNGEIRNFIQQAYIDINRAPPSWTESQLYEIYRRFDINGNYQLDFNECVSFVQELVNQFPRVQTMPVQTVSVNQQQLRVIFDRLDINRDGVLEWNNGEIRNFIQQAYFEINRLPPSWTESQLYETYRRFDINGNYRLDFNECVSFVQELGNRFKGAPPQLPVSLAPQPMPQPPNQLPRVMTMPAQPMPVMPVNQLPRGLTMPVQMMPVQKTWSY